jgi:hypothetical protein
MARVWILVILVAGGAAMACSDTDNVREDVLLCEEAASHYASCCGHDLAGLQCRYAFSCLIDCNHTGDSSEPDFDTGTSRCLMNLSCADIAARGFCGQARETLAHGGTCK